MDPETVIRHAVSSDVDSFRELRLEALKNHPTAFAMDYDDMASRSREYWEGRLKIDPMEDGLFFAEAGSELVGMSGIHRNIGKKISHTAMVWGVYVKPGWRGRRIAKSLVRACLNWASHLGLVNVRLGVVTENKAAVRCYERIGFSIYGTEPKVIFYEGMYYDDYLMSIELNG